MNPADTRRASVELVCGRGNLEHVGERPLHHYWPVLSPYFRDVLLVPQRDPEGAKITWTWREPRDARPISPAELKAVRRKLERDGELLTQNVARSAAANGASPRSSTGGGVERVPAAMQRVIAHLGRLSDEHLAPFACRTETGVRLHSWGAHLPALVRYPDEIVAVRADAAAARGRKRWRRRPLAWAIGGAIALVGASSVFWGIQPPTEAAPDARQATAENPPATPNAAKNRSAHDPESSRERVTAPLDPHDRVTERLSGAALGALAKAGNIDASRATADKGVIAAPEREHLVAPAIPPAGLIRPNGAGAKPDGTVSPRAGAGVTEDSDRMAADLAGETPLAQLPSLQRVGEERGGTDQSAVVPTTTEAVSARAPDDVLAKAERPDRATPYERDPVSADEGTTAGVPSKDERLGNTRASAAFLRCIVVLALRCEPRLLVDRIIPTLPIKRGAALKGVSAALPSAPPTLRRIVVRWGVGFTLQHESGSLVREECAVGEMMERARSDLPTAWQARDAQGVVFARVLFTGDGRAARVELSDRVRAYVWCASRIPETLSERERFLWRGRATPELPAGAAVTQRADELRLELPLPADGVLPALACFDRETGWALVLQQVALNERNTSADPRAGVVE